MKKHLSFCLGLAAIIGLASGPVLAATPTIPAGATITDASFKVYVAEKPANPTSNPVVVGLHRITMTQPWSEGTVSWNSFKDANGVHQYDPAPVDTITVYDKGWHSFDIKSLVQDWVDGKYPNNGFVLAQDPNETRFLSYNSSESTLLPEVTIQYLDGNNAPQTLILNRNTTNVEDLYIWEYFPDDKSRYAKTLVYTGPVLKSLKKSLFRFDFDLLQGLDTFTPGYWKNHADPKKKKYDSTWDKIGPAGADTVFLNASGITWMDALSTPTRGNAFWTLARAYAAARLNKLANGSVALPVDKELAEAEKLLKDTLTANPSDPMIGKKSKVWMKALTLATILDDFNNGL